ncbi:MAG: alpha/beta hydrolase [Pseudonocardia sp.]
MPRIEQIANLPVISWWPVRAVLLALALLAVAAVIATVRRGAPVARRGVTLGVATGLVLLNAAAAVNAYFAYYPTLGEALGGSGPDETSLAAADADEGSIPAQGQVVPLAIPGTVSGFQGRDAQVYLPPAWFARPRPELPVIMLLHGSPGRPTDWTEGGDAAATADAFAARHGGVAPVLVMPDVNGDLVTDTECVNSSLGAAETYLTVDVPAVVQRTLATKAPGPGRWAVAGFSEGGACAIMLALRHPDLFAAFGDFGGLLGPRVADANADPGGVTVAQLFGGSTQAFLAHEPSALLADPAPAVRELGGWFEVGSADPQPLAAAQALAPLAQRAGLTTCLVVVPGGGHTFDVWSAALRSSLPWMAARLGIGSPAAGTAAGCPPAA